MMRVSLKFGTREALTSLDPDRKSGRRSRKREDHHFVEKQEPYDHISLEAKSLAPFLDLNWGG